MNEHSSPVAPHRSWFLPHKRHAVDKLGVAVALTFLVVIALFVGGRGEKAAEKNESQEQFRLLAQGDIRPLPKPSLELMTAAPAQSVTGLRQELKDPRRGQ